MMKHILFLLLFTLSTIGFSQLSGDILTSGRKITEQIAYTLPMNVTGKLVFDIAVNTEGKVTSCILNKAESTIISTRYAYEAKNRILSELKFEAGNGFPTFHQGQITITSAINDGN